MAEYGEAIGVAAGSVGIKAGDVGQQDEEAGGRRSGPVVGHRDCAGDVLEPGLGGGFMGDRLEQLARVAEDPALDQPAALVLVKGAVEGLAVEPVRIDIMEEVGGRDRGMTAVERHDDLADAGLNDHRHEVLGGRRRRRRRCRYRLRQEWCGDRGKEGGGKDSMLHGEGP
jgi:hypothetical protein